VMRSVLAGAAWWMTALSDNDGVDVGCAVGDRGDSRRSPMSLFRVLFPFSVMCPS